MKYQVEFHPSAAEEVVAIKRWYLERSVGATARFDEELRAAIASLADDPLMW